MAYLEDLNAGQHSSETDSFTPRRYRHMARHIRNARRVLDVGCNTGRGGEVLRVELEHATLVGCEMVKDRVERVPTGTYDQVHVGSLQSNVAKLEPFDAVVMGEIMEHVPYSNLDAFIAAARSVLLPGGRVILTTPNPHYLFLRWRGGSVLGGSHVSVHCHTALAELLRSHGFRVVAIEGTGRVSRLMGTRFPLPLYGSYLLVAEVTSD